MKIKHGFLFALAGLAFSAVVPTADATVYAPGLAQAQFDGSSTDKASDIAAADNRTYAPGPIMANTTGSANDWNNASWSWANNRVFGYIGEMWVEEGTTYTFGKSVDDWTYIVVNGTNIIDNGTYNAITFGSYTAAETGWVPIEVRVGNGGGGAGLANGAKYGVAYNTAGNTVQNDFKSAANGWAALLDPGDCSLLRVVYSNTDMMTIDGVAVDGNDLVVTASFTGLAGPGALTAFYGAGDGGTVSNDWDHCAVAATPAAGDTASAAYRIAGAGSAAFVAFRLSATAGTSTPVRQWSDTYALALASPAFKLASTDVGYTNLSYVATCLGLGQGASSVDIDVQLALDDAFSNVVQTERLALTGIGSEAVTFTELITNTTYYARVVGTNNKQESGASSTVSKTTLDPGFAVGTITFVSGGFTTLSFSGTVTDWGAGSSSADISLELSTDADFPQGATLSFSGAATLSGATPASLPLAASGLAGETDYHARLRIVNTWGLVTFVPLAGTCSTYEIPLAATGIGYTFSADGSTLDISFGVTEVYDGASCRATLVYNGRTVGAKNFSTSGLLLWEDIPAAASAAPATVTVVATVDGVDYTKTWTVTVTPGSSAVTVTDVAAHASAATAIRIRPGDVVTLPELFGTASYTVMHDRFLALDGNILTALEPGIAGVKCIDTAGAETTLAVLVLPEVIGNGSIYIYDETASTKEYWTRASSWEKLGSASNDSWPCQPDDIAVIPFYDTTGTQYISHESDFSVGGILFGNYRDVETTCILQRHKDASTSVITFQRTDGELAFAKVTPNTTANRSNTLRFGGYAITLECASSVETDACSNPTDAALNRGFVSYSACTIHLPEGRYWAVDGLPGYNLNMGGTINPPTLSGEGTFWKKGMGGFTFGSQNAFYGTVLDTSHGHFGGFNRAAPVFWHGPGGTNVSVSVVGWVSPQLGNPSVSSSGYGRFRTGWDPAHNSDGPHPDVPWNPRKTMTLRGGTYEASSTENSSWGVGVRNPRIYERLVVESGMSFVSEAVDYRSNSSGHPINYIEWGALDHADKGTLVIWDHSRRSVAATTTSTNAMTFILNHDAHLVGQGADGDCLASDVYPIIPWIVAPTTTDDSSWRNTMFASFDAAGRLTRPIWNNTALDAVASPYSNAYLWDKTIEIGSDVTLNSLFMNNSGKNKWLGEGRKLTITSGGLVLHGSDTAIGLPERTDNGSLVLGDADHPGYVFAKSSNASKPNQIWADVTAPGGFVSSYSGALVLGGNQTGIGGELVVNAGVLTLGTADLSCSLANNLPIRICAGATLAVPRADAVKKNLLQFDGAAAQFGKVEVPEGVAAKCKKAYWRDYPETQEWQNLRRGVYTGDEATALANPKVVYDPEHFSGAGTLEVLRDDLAMPLVIRMK